MKQWLKEWKQEKKTEVFINKEGKQTRKTAEEKIQEKVEMHFLVTCNGSEIDQILH